MRQMQSPVATGKRLVFVAVQAIHSVTAATNPKETPRPHVLTGLEKVGQYADKPS
jgi:hypothetical protein